MKATSVLKEFGGVNQGFVGIRQSVFTKKYEVFCREGTMPYLYAHESDNPEKIEQLFTKLFFLLMASDNWEEFGSAVEAMVKNGKLPV
jgi:hypothetical protein